MTEHDKPADELEGLLDEFSRALLGPARFDHQVPIRRQAIRDLFAKRFTEEQVREMLRRAAHAGNSGPVHCICEACKSADEAHVDAIIAEYRKGKTE